MMEGPQVREMDVPMVPGKVRQSSAQIQVNSVRQKKYRTLSRWKGLR
jgi:hypothetical protein